LEELDNAEKLKMAIKTVVSYPLANLHLLLIYFLQKGFAA